MIWWAMIFTVTTSVSAFARPECTPLTPEGTKCKSRIELLHPGQTGFGPRERDDKADELKHELKKGDKDYKEFLKANPIPVAIGPQNLIVPVDHHHLGKAIEAIHEHRVDLKVLANRHLDTVEQFWQFMADHHWVYLKDLKGNPITYKQLPGNFAAMQEDPYRDLAGFVRDRGGFVKNAGDYYVEFDWALFFRQKLTNLDLVTDHGFKEAVKRAIELAHSPAAAGMKGYTPTSHGSASKICDWGYTSRGP